MPAQGDVLEMTRECREALDCGGLTPLFLSVEVARNVELPSCVLLHRFNLLRASTA